MDRGTFALPSAPLRHSPNYNVGGYGYELWLPSIIKGLSITNTFVIGIINAVPYFAAGVVMIVVARYYCTILGHDHGIPRRHGGGGGHCLH